jgi:hypothetical protein
MAKILFDYHIILAMVLIFNLKKIKANVLKQEDYFVYTV